jgi:hypothetical protein
MAAHGSRWAGSDNEIMSEPIETATRAAFGELVALLREIDARYLGPEFRIADPSSIVDGHAFALNLLSAGIDLYLDADPERPRFVSLVSPARKFLGDNPDAFYFLAPLAGARAYRIRGNLSGSVYTSFTFRKSDASGWASEIFAARNDRELDVARDGSFELVLAREQPPGVSERGFVELDPDAVSVTSRHYFENPICAQLDPTLRVPLAIEPLVAPRPAAPLDDAATAARMRSVVREATLGMPPRDPKDQPAWVSVVPNQLGVPELYAPSESAWGAVDNAYSMGPFLLNPSDALIMEGRLPECAFANVVLWNRFMQSHDYRERTASLNRRQMTLGPDGRSFRIAISASDPGIRDWLDTGGRSSGLIFWRFLLPTGPFEPIRSRVVPASASL